MKITVMSYNTQHCLNYRTRKIDFDMAVSTIQKYGTDIVEIVSSDHRLHIASIEL